MTFWKRTSIEHVCSDVLIRSAAELRHAMDVLSRDDSLLDNPYADELMHGLFVTENELDRRGIDWPGRGEEREPQAPVVSHHIVGAA